MTETKKFDPNCKEFEANGMKFFVNNKLSIARYEQYEKLQPRLAYGIDFETMFKLHNQLYQNLNDRKFADSAVICHNLMSGIRDLLDSKREDAALLMCALAINGENEDPGVYDEQVQKEKIEHWRKEGFAMEGFFLFAASIMKGLPKAYNAYIMDQVTEKGDLKITV
jgi:hypothetical protein